MNKRHLSLLAGVLALAMLAGCAPSDTSDGFKPPPHYSKADIQKQIDTVKADSKLDAGAKAMVVKNLEKQLQNAK